MFARLRFPRGLVLIAALGTLGAFTACAGGNSTTSPASSGTAAAATPGGTSTASAPTGGGASGDGGSNTTSLSDRASRALDNDFTISYRMNGPSTAATNMRVYWEAPGKRWRVDQATSAGTITLIRQGGGTIYCLEMQKTCTKTTMNDAQTSQIPFFSEGLTEPDAFATYVTDQLGADVSTSAKRIAGMDATCYDAGSGSASGEVCFGKNDLILAWTGSIGGQELDLVATKVKASVSANDLEAPYKVEDLGNLFPP